MVHRNQYKSVQHCPKCNTSRHPGKGRGCTMLYHSLVDHGRELFGNEASARHMKGWKKRVASPGLMSDLHDGESWKAEVADPVMNQEGEVQMWISD